MINFLKVFTIDASKKYVYGDSFLNLEKKEKTTIILAFSDYEGIQLAHNWFLHIKKCNLESKSILCCFDIQAYGYALKHKIPCLYYNNDDKNEHEVYLQKVFRVITHLIEKYNVDIIYSEIDIIILRDFVDDFILELKNSQYKSCFLTNLHFDRHNINRYDGIIMFYSKDFLEYIKTFLLKYKNCTPKEQTAKMLSECLPLNEMYYTNKTFWDEPEVKNQIIDTCYMIHYNMTKTSKYPFLEDVIGNRNLTKIYLMMQDGFWLL